MEEFAAGTDITLTVQHSYNGASLAVTDLQYQVVDSQGNILVDFTTPVGFNPANSATSIPILKANNQTSDKVDVRQVNINLVTSAGTYKNTVFYKLLGDLTKLVVMTDSFMTFPEAVVARVKMSDRLEYYDALPDAIKAVALENSFKTLMKLSFKQPVSTSCEPYSLKGLTESQFRALPVDFTTALKRAQIVQCDAIVENSPIRDKIREGIISETIGESSMFFKQSTNIGSNVKFPGVDDKAYELLSAYLFTSGASAQIWRLNRA